MIVTIHSVDLQGREYTDTYKWTQRYAKNIDLIMREAATKFKVYTITAPDGTVIAKLL